MEAIVHKRADKALFAGDALEYMIKMTGGYLRDLFDVILRAALRANRRGCASVELEDAKAATVDLKAELSRVIGSQHHEALQKIFSGEKQMIQNRDELLKLLEGRAVLEYNGNRWCELHPLLKELLIENKVIGANLHWKEEHA